MGSQIIITKWEERLLSFTMEEGRMVEANVEPPPSERILGNIYVGKVKNIVENIAAAFVEIENGILCYLSLSERGEPIFVNPNKRKSVKAGDELFVQLVRENVKTKQPVVSVGLNLTGRYVVLVKDKSHVFVSSKIKDKAARDRLFALLKGRLGEGYGFIARTNAAFADEESIVEEAGRLAKEFEKLCEEGVHRTCFSCLYRAPSAYVCNVRDVRRGSLDAIVTDDGEAYRELLNYLEDYQREDVPKLRLHQDEAVTLNALYGLRTQFEKAFMRKLWLKSGGSVVIEYTEACTVIDVNTEKAIQGKKKNRGIYRKVNLEAAREIAYQLRLRNVSGIVIVDFIDMEDKGDRQELMDCMRELVAKDPVQTDVVDMTQLGLVELTRKKLRKPLWEQMGSDRERGCRTARKENDGSDHLL